MRVRFLHLLASALVVVAGLCSSFAFGQESSGGTRGRRSETTEAPAHAGKLIEFEVTIIERTGEPLPGQKGKPPTAAQIAEMEKEGKAATVQRLQLVALENVESRLQLGEATPVVTSRSVRSRDAGGGFGGGGGGVGFPGTESVTYMDVGTTVTVTSRVETDGKVVANIQISRTNVAPPKAAEKGEGQEAAAPGYARRQTSSVTTTARIGTNETVVLAGQQGQGGSSPNETWVLVTAKVQ